MKVRRTHARIHLPPRGAFSGGKCGRVTASAVSLCEEFSRPESKAGRWPLELVAALVLSLVILPVNVVSNCFLVQRRPGFASSTSAKNSFVEIAGNPGLLPLLAGPLMSLRAVTEERIGVFPVCSSPPCDTPTQIILTIDSDRFKLGSQKFRFAIQKRPSTGVNTVHGFSYLI